MRNFTITAPLLAITLAALNQALAESIKALNARLDQANDATRKGFADQKLTIDNIVEGVQVIRERSNDTNVRIGSLSEELEAMRQTVQALQAQQQAALAPPPVPVAAFVPPASSSPPRPPPQPARSARRPSRSTILVIVSLLFAIRRVSRALFPVGASAW